MYILMGVEFNILRSTRNCCHLFKIFASFIINFDISEGIFFITDFLEIIYR